jgi:hypothetical protein
MAVNLGVHINHFVMQSTLGVESPFGLIRTDEEAVVDVLNFCSSGIWTPGKRRLSFPSWRAIKNAFARVLAFAVSPHYWISLNRTILAGMQAGESFLLHRGSHSTHWNPGIACRD